jgi:hypothetical protein
MSARSCSGCGSPMALERIGRTGGHTGTSVWFCAPCNLVDDGTTAPVPVGPPLDSADRREHEASR